MQIVEETFVKSKNDNQVEKESSQELTEGVRHRTLPSCREGQEPEFVRRPEAAMVTHKCQVAFRTETEGQKVPASARSVNVEQLGRGGIEVEAQAGGTKGDRVELGIQDMQRTGIEGCGETVRQHIIQIELAEGEAPGTVVSVSQLGQTAGDRRTQKGATPTSIRQHVTPSALTFHICRESLELGERAVLEPVHRGTQTETFAWCDAQVQTSAEGIAEAFQSQGGVEEMERLGGLYDGHDQGKGKGKASDTTSWVGGGDGTNVDGTGNAMELEDDDDCMDLDDDEDLMDVD